jgi:hypothetical protein
MNEQESILCSELQAYVTKVELLKKVDLELAALLASQGDQQAREIVYITLACKN